MLSSLSASHFEPVVTKIKDSGCQFVLYRALIEKCLFFSNHHDDYYYN